MADGLRPRCTRRVAAPRRQQPRAGGRCGRCRRAPIEPVLAGEHAARCWRRPPAARPRRRSSRCSRGCSTEDWRGLTRALRLPAPGAAEQPARAARAATPAWSAGGSGCWHGDVGQPSGAGSCAEPPDMPADHARVARGDARLHAASTTQRWFAGRAGRRGRRGPRLRRRRPRLAPARRARAGQPARRPGAPADRPVGHRRQPRRAARLAAPATCRGPRRVVNPPGRAPADRPRSRSTTSAAWTTPPLVIARLHRGEKRLVFVDSRARVEELAAALRGRDVDDVRLARLARRSTSGGGPSRRSPRRATASSSPPPRWSSASTSATSTGSSRSTPRRTVAVVPAAARPHRPPRRHRPQRLFLATGDDALLRAAGLLLRWGRGLRRADRPAARRRCTSSPSSCWPSPCRSAASAATLWAEWLGEPFVLGPEAAAAAAEITDHLVAAGLPRRRRRHARHRRRGRGGPRPPALPGAALRLHLAAAVLRPPRPDRDRPRPRRDAPGPPAGRRRRRRRGAPPRRPQLGGSSTSTGRRRVVQVEPTDAPGVARWSGSGQPLGAAIARGIREVLLGSDPAGVTLSRRAGERLTHLRAEHPWVRPDATSLVTDGRGRPAGGRSPDGGPTSGSPSRRRPATGGRRRRRPHRHPRPRCHPAASSVGHLDRSRASIDLAPWVTAEAVDGLKFSECLPRGLATEVVTRRLADPESTNHVLGERLVGWRDAT